MLLYGLMAPKTEHAALVGLVTGAARRIEADHSLDELAGLADAAGASVALRMLQERRVRRGRRRRGDLRQ
jgi:50S ribosomal subunit-associated GTPase HflX